MRILFAGSPEFALPSLQAIHTCSRHRLVAVLTAPGRAGHKRAGRGIAENPVARYAEEKGIPILRPQRLDAQAREDVRKYAPNVLAVAAYGTIFGPRFLELFSRGGINLHPSLLPLHRGPAPIPAAILAGDRKGGISIQRIALKMDAGDIILQETFDIDAHATTANLSEHCAERGAALLVKAIDLMETEKMPTYPQNESEASYCGLIKKEDGFINWARSAVQIDRAVRAYLPWPLAHTRWEGRILNVTKAQIAENLPEAEFEAGRVLGVDRKLGILVQTGQGILALQNLQLQSRKIMDWKSFINGNVGMCSSMLG